MAKFSQRKTQGRVPANAPVNSRVERDIDAAEDAGETYDPSALEQRVLSEHGQDGEQWDCRVYLLSAAGKAGGHEEFLFSMDPTEFPIEERLRDEFGTGHYRVKVKRNNMFYTLIDYRVRARARPMQPAAAVSTGDAVTLALLQEMKSQRDVLQAIVEKLSHPAASAVPADPFAGIEKIATVMASINGLQRGSTVENSADLIMKGIELASRVRGGGDDGDGGDDEGGGVLGVLREIIRKLPIEKVFEAMAAAGSPGQPLLTAASPAQERPVAAAPAAPEPAKPASDAPPMVGPVRQFLTQLDALASRAAAGGDPALWADVVAETTPPEVLNILLSQDDPLAFIMKFAPHLRQYHGWFSRLLDCLVGSGDDGAPVDPANVGDHAADGNGDTGASFDGDAIG